MGQSSTKMCAECDQPAKIFISFVKGGKVQTMAWCAQHAEAAGVLDPRAYALLEHEDRAERRRGESIPRCVVCDCSQRDFERQGRFGCPACYKTFAGLLPPLLLRMHRGAEHRGKIPVRGADPAVMRHRLGVLQEQLNDDVRTEKFEGAARTRDAIASIKAKLLAPANAPASPADASTGERPSGLGAPTTKPASAPEAK